jgi:hypothetical protein
VNWIAKQLRSATTPEDLVIKVEWDRKNLLSQARAIDLKEKVDCLLRDGHQQLIPDDANPRRFTLEWTRKLQKSKGRSTAPVLEGISHDLEDFYSRVVEKLVAYVPPAPKLAREVATSEATPAAVAPSEPSNPTPGVETSVEPLAAAAVAVAVVEEGPGPMVAVEPAT